MSSRKVKLSLHTMFNAQDRSSRSRIRRGKPASTTATPSSSMIPSVAPPRPSPAYPSVGRPHTPITNPDNDARSSSYLSPHSTTSSSPSSSHYHSSRFLPRLRRQPSAIDVAMAMEIERCSTAAGLPENIGLGLLEPRPRAVSCTSLVSSVGSICSANTSGACSLAEVMSDNEAVGREVVLDGIFEVLERGR